MIETPIRKELTLTVVPDRAFTLFTEEISRWWPMASHSVGGDDAVGVSIEGRVGGEVVEATGDGARHVWGTITLWDPPRRLVMTWHPGRSADDLTVVEVRFDAHGAGTRVTLEHRGWEQTNWADDRASYETGWDPLLARYEALARTASPMSPGPA